MPNTQNIGLSITPRETNVTFLDWRLGQDGPDNSNMIKLDTAWGQMKNMVDGAVAMAGGPNVAETVADMTDTEKVYVYLGDETGYTAGNWYYYNGSAWVSGGVYQAAAVQTDDTLTQEGIPADAKAVGDAIANITVEVDDTLTQAGMAADAKAVGDAVEEINTQVDEVNDLLFEDANAASLWRTGSLAVATGKTQDTSATLANTIRSIAIPDVVSNIIRVNTAYKYLLFVYSSNTTFSESTYVGWWDWRSDVFSKDSPPPAWYQDDINLDEVRTAAGQLSPSVDPVYFRIIIRKTDGGDIGSEGLDAASASLELKSIMTFYQGTDTTLKVEGRAADAKATGDAAFGDVNEIRLWKPGAIATNTGKSADSTNTIRSSFAISPNIRKIILKDSGYKYGLYCYSSDIQFGTVAGSEKTTYIGFWDASTGTFSKTSFKWITGDVDLDEVRAAAKQFDPTVDPKNLRDPIYFRVALRDTAEHNIGEGGFGLSAASALKFVPYNTTDKIEIAGIPVLTLSGNADGMSKDNEVNLRYSIFEHTGNCTVKWQGSSSINYPKKNYTIKLSSDDTLGEGQTFGGLDMKALWRSYIKQYRSIVGDPSISESTLPTWGNQTKFCAKANWIDASHLRNIVNARLWGEIVASRGNRNGGTNEQTTALTSYRSKGDVATVNDLPNNDNTIGDVRYVKNPGAYYAWNGSNWAAYSGEFDNRPIAPNYGAIDGFPVWITINGKNQGLYTLNIPKDKWTFAMSGDTYEYVVGGEANTNNYCRWKQKLKNGDNDIDWSKVNAYDSALDVATDTHYAVGDLAFFDDTLKICTVAPAMVNNTLVKATWEDLFAVEVSKKISKKEPGETPETSDEQKLNGYRAALEHFTEVLNKAADSGTTTGADGTWKTSSGIGDLMDIDSVFDYYIFNCCINGNDGFGKNTLFGSYGGTADGNSYVHSKWFVSAYDLDTTHGFQAYGSKTFTVSANGANERANFTQAADFNGLAALAIGDPTFKARYWELRNGILSDDHVFERFMEFGVYFSDNAYRLERNLWPQLPATSMHTLLQATEFYKRHCAYLDKQVGPLENS